MVSIIGPTASGKSSLAVDVARRLIEADVPAEIINTDSMLVYRGMDIGTAKPSLDERGDVPHHLIDLWEVDHVATVADFQLLARSAVADCQERGVLPVLVGGSALYVRAILDVFEFPRTDASVRARLEAELAELGVEELYRRLVELAPEAAAEMSPGNARRTVRALEVIELTGAHTPVLPTFTYALPGVRQIGLALERPVMDARIGDRVERMWAQGLVAEVEELRARGLAEGVTASRAIGYRQVLDFLDGRCTEAEAKQSAINRTRRFARKQLGWWRRDDRIHWLDAQAPNLADRVLADLSPSAANGGL